MKNKRDLTVFIVILILVGTTFAGGVFYLRGQEEQAAILATTAATTTIPTVAPVTVIASSSSTLVPLSLPYALTTSSRAYWPKYLDTNPTTGGALVLGASSSTRSDHTFVSGASSWKNYTVRANVSWLGGGWFDIAARVASNTQDFIYCEFGPNAVGIFERTHNNDVLITSADAVAGGPGTNGDFGMSIYGSDVGCTIARKEAVGAHLVKDPAPTGGIGFIFWDSKENTSRGVVKNVRVTALTKNTVVFPFPLAVATPSLITVTSTPSASPGQAKPAAPKPLPPAPVIQALAFPYTESAFRGDGNWSATWGTLAIDAMGALDLHADASTTGANAHLKNSDSWGDLQFGATFDWPKGQSLGLVARYVNDNNYVACEFTETSFGDVHIELQQIINGDEHTLAAGDILDYTLPYRSDATAYIKVSGANGVCSFNNHVISNLNFINSWTLNPPFTGAIGFTIWDPTPNNAEIVVHGVDVHEAY